MRWSHYGNRDGKILVGKKLRQFFTAIELAFNLGKPFFRIIEIVCSLLSDLELSNLYFLVISTPCTLVRLLVSEAFITERAKVCNFVR